MFYFPKSKVTYKDKSRDKDKVEDKANPNMHGIGEKEFLDYGPESPNLRAIFVQFENGGHTKPHKHEGDQVLIVTEGLGFVECEGEARINIQLLDRVIIPAGTLHQHGARENEDMTHIAVTVGRTIWEEDKTKVNDG